MRRHLMRCAGGSVWWGDDGDHASRSRASLHRVASVRMSASRRSEKLGRQQRAGVPVRAPANNLCTRCRSPISYPTASPVAAPSGPHWCMVGPSVLRRDKGCLAAMCCKLAATRSELEIWHMQAWIWWHRGGIASSCG
jgi:hypothetical protein